MHGAAMLRRARCAHHRPSKRASSSMRRPPDCATSTAHRRPACNNRAASVRSQAGHGAASARWCRARDRVGAAAHGGGRQQLKFFFVFNSEIRDSCNYGNNVLKDPSLSSDTTAAVDLQSGPRPESRHLRQPALEGMTNSARTETPLQADRNMSDHDKRRRTAAA
ncbi:MLO-like protein 11 [Dorcoceras hygrometricum]|uniref:MLO-like protein 11 n=1 Tax=Dorcoceras hygrometricum TaxID=472368 RepID=A0A2Z7AWS9_9LAMI|nr:MLO-like protein 11 [Dorcoceras hygrometricum]